MTLLEKQQKNYLIHSIFYVTIKITYLKMLVVTMFPKCKLGDIFTKYVITHNSSVFLNS